MIDEEMGRMLRKLTMLASSLNAVIDAGQHVGISKADVYARIEDKTIFQYLGEKFEDMSRWALGNFSEEDKWHLLGEWQSMANAIDPERKLGVSNSGICLLLAYVIEGIQMRTFSREIWPGPDPW
jgi:hypothetical protein